MMARKKSGWLEPTRVEAHRGAGQSIIVGEVVDLRNIEVVAVVERLGDDGGHYDRVVDVVDRVDIHHPVIGRWRKGAAEIEVDLYIDGGVDGGLNVADVLVVVEIAIGVQVAIGVQIAVAIEIQIAVVVPDGGVNGLRRILRLSLSLPLALTLSLALQLGLKCGLRLCLILILVWILLMVIVVGHDASPLKGEAPFGLLIAASLLRCVDPLASDAISA